MKFLLQDRQTAKFMRCDSMWTADMEEALNFLSVQRAVFYGMKELKDPFQVMRIEAGGRAGAVTITISNPLWPGYSLSALIFSGADVRPMLDAAPAFSSSLEAVAIRGKNQRWVKHPMAARRAFGLLSLL
jgi:hypothetical protein